MKIHEYQAKALFAQYGIPIPQGRAASSPSEALEAAQALGPPPYVVKAQIHAGGRGKGAGLRWLSLWRNSKAGSAKYWA